MSFGFGTSIGNANHISIALLAKALGVDVKQMKVVVFNSASDAAVAVMGGHVDVAAATANTVAAQLEAGRMRALAIAAPQRLAGDTQRCRPGATFERGCGCPRSTAAPSSQRLTPAQTTYREAVFAKVVEDPSCEQEIESNPGVPALCAERGFQKTTDEEYAKLSWSCAIPDWCTQKGLSDVVTKLLVC